MTGQFYQDAISNIRRKLLSGVLTYDEAKKEAQPIIDEMNEKARAVAKKWGQRHRNFTFSELMR